MFHCEVTHKNSALDEKCHKLVVQTRPRVYTQRVWDEDMNEWITVHVGTGSEIVKEVNASEEGLKVWASLSDEDRRMMFPLVKSK